MYIYKTVALEQFLEENKDSRIGFASSNSHLALAVQASKAVENLINHFAKEGWEYVRSEEFRTGFFRTGLSSFMDGSTNPLLQMFIFRKEYFADASSVKNSYLGAITDSKKDLKDDSYRIYLQRKFLIERSFVFDKIICGDKLFESLEDALDYAHQLDAKAILIKEKEEIKNSANFKLIRDKNFNEFKESGFRCLFLENGNCAIETSKNIFYIYESTDACRSAINKFATNQKEWVPEKFVEKVNLSSID